METLLTAKQAADILGFHYVTVRLMARRGQLPAIRVGGSWRFNPQALDAWLKSKVNSADAI